MTTDFYLVANWKMHFTPEEAKELYQQFTTIPNGSRDNVHLWVAAPAISLPTLQSVKHGKVLYGAQNVHYEESGAYTGEISVPMVRSTGGDFTLIGHSERRHIFGERDSLLKQRTEGALTQGLAVIFCIGETLDEREDGETTAVIHRQLSPVLEFFTEYPGKILVAYEPVWAIGTGKVASAKEIEAAHLDIKNFTQESTAPVPPILYGGSVKPGNIAEISALENVNGALVGGASLSLESFKGLYEGIS